MKWASSFCLSLISLTTFACVATPDTDIDDGESARLGAEAQDVGEEASAGAEQVAVEAAGAGERRAAVTHDSLGRPLSRLTAQIVSENHAADDELHLLARVQLQPDEVVEIYEPREGLIILSNAGAPAAPSAFDPRALQGRTLAELWDILAPGAPMPDALHEAAQRLDEVRFTARPEGMNTVRQHVEIQAGGGGGASFPKGSAASPPSAMASTSGGGTSGWCDTTFFSHWSSACDNGGYETDFSLCRDNWWNGISAWVDDGYSTDATVCSASGAVVLTIDTDEEWAGSWSVLEDTFRSTTVHDSGCLGFWNDCPYVIAKVIDAAGDRFHFRYVSDIE